MSHPRLPNRHLHANTPLVLTSSSSLAPPQNTCSDELVFAPGVVELSILLGIHEDGEAEPDEHFDLFLYKPWGGARLGSQHRARVTILDAELGGAVTHHSQSTLHLDGSGGGSDAYDVGSWEEKTVATEQGDDAVVAVAGTLQNATLVARNALGGLRGFGGDVFEAWVEVRGAALEEGGIYGDDVASFDGNYSSSYSGSAAGAPSAAAAAGAVTRVEDLGSGNYTVSYQVSHVQGRNTTLHVQRKNSSGYGSQDFCRGMHVSLSDPCLPPQPPSNMLLILPLLGQQRRGLLSSRGTLPAGRAHRTLLRGFLLPERGVPESRQASCAKGWGVRSVWNI